MKIRKPAFKSPDWATRRRPSKLIYSAEPKRNTKQPISTEPVFPPNKRRFDLDEFLRTVNSACINPLEHPAWFEDANYLYFADYGEGASRLVLALDKLFYYVDVPTRPKDILDLTRIQYDARFRFGQDFPARILFGTYHDNNLGRVFTLSEPKDAKDMLVSLQDLGGEYTWLENAQGVKYYRHESVHHHRLHVVLPVGSRLVEDKHLTVVYQNKALEDRDFYQQLFEENLRAFAGFRDERTIFEPVILPPTPEELAEAERKKTEKVARDTALAEAISRTTQLLDELLKDLLSEFNLTLELKISDEISLLGPSQEVVVLRLLPPDETESIFYRSTDIADFLRLSPETHASSFTKSVVDFLSSHRERFHTFKRLYDVNSSYHNLINPRSRPPRLDYQYIFNDL